MEIPSEEEHKVAENALALQEVTSNYNEDDDAEGDSHDGKDSGECNNNDLFDHTLLEVTQSSTEPTPSKPVVRKSQRTKNFTIKEDILLCKAWLNVSLDAGHDSEQNRKPYWSRIYEYFKQHKDFVSDRSIKSLTTRWGVVHQAVGRFTECYSEIQHVKQDKNTELDEINDAKELYYSLYKGFFKFDYCWNVLKDQQKWIVHASEKKRLKTCKDSSPGVSSQTSAAATIERPPLRRKAEKETPRRRKNRAIEEDGSQTQTSAAEAEAEAEATTVERPLSRKAEKETPKRRMNKANEEELPSQKRLNNMAQVEKTIPFGKEQEEREKEREREREDQIREEEIMKLDLRNMAPHQVKYWTKKQLDILQKHNLM